MTSSPSGERALAIVVAECATLFRPTLAGDQHGFHVNCHGGARLIGLAQCEGVGWYAVCMPEDG